MQETTSDFQIYVEDTGGSGTPLLLIHGYPLNSEMWKPQLEALAGPFRVIAPDLRGHGLTPPTPGVSMDLFAQDLKTVLERTGVDKPVILCGLSMGGYIAFAFYRLFPRSVSGLILAATRSKPDSATAKANRDKQAALSREKGVAAVVEDMLPKMMSPDTYRYNPGLVDQARQIMMETSSQGMASALLAMKDRPDSTSLLSEIPFPVLVVHGKDDALIPLEEAEEMEAQLQHGILETIPEAGHLLNLEQPGLFNRAVMNYLLTLQDFPKEGK